MPAAVRNPLIDPPPPRVDLPNAPLAWVVVMVRFPMVLEVEQPDVLASFQFALRDRYPLGVLEQVQELTVGSQPLPTKKVWRFQDEKAWRVSLSQDFLALETRAYSSSEDLFERLAEVLRALMSKLQPARVERLGVRYIDRICGDELRDIQHLVRPEIAGVACTPAMQNCQHAFSDNAFRVDDNLLIARWGLLPANATMDPSVIAPLESPSWILDLDMVSQQPFSFEEEAIVSRARAFASRIYTFFRWATTTEFLRRYGGTP
jgi:uncharacterized protein (TIGR04255 family)